MRVYIFCLFVLFLNLFKIFRYSNPYLSYIFYVHVAIGVFESTFRYPQLWLTLAEQHLLRIGVDWSDVERNCFNDRINPDDEDLGAQIVRVLKTFFVYCTSFVSLNNSLRR
jgi:hypothetical protein